VLINSNYCHGRFLEVTQDDEYIYKQNIKVVAYGDQGLAEYYKSDTDEMQEC